MNEMTCPKCSGPREAKELYCTFCGEIFQRIEPSPSAISERRSTQTPPGPEPVAPAAHGSSLASDDAYRPPQTPVQLESKGSTAETLAEIERKTRNAWIASMVVAAFTLVLLLILSRMDIGVSLDATALIEVGLVLALGFGVKAKSRVCGTLLFLYWVGSKLYMWSELGVSVSGTLVAVSLGYYFFYGMMAAFEYHGLLSGEATNSVEPVKMAEVYRGPAQ